MKTLISLLLILLAVIGIGYFLTNGFSQIKEQTSKNNLAPSVTPSMEDTKIIGWTAYWDEDNTLNALESHMTETDVFSPILYQIAKDGTLEPLTVNNRETVLGLARENNIPVVPVIGDDFDHDRVTQLLTNKKSQEAFIEELISEAKKENYSGWSIDIETLKESDKDAFSAFVKNTAEKLEKNNLELTMILYAKDEKETLDAALAQDYKLIGQYAHHIILMTYGYHNGSTSAGGQAPLDWYRSVLAYTRNNVSHEKIGLGLTTHGYEWSKKEVLSFTYPQIAERIEQFDAEVRYDEQSSQVAEYEENNENHEIWFEDAKTIKEKMDIAMKEFGITTFAIWRVGAEDPQIWTEIKK